MSDNEYDVHLWLRIERGGGNRRLPGVVRPLLCAVVPLRRVQAPRPRFGRRGRTRRLHPCLAARRRAADHRLGTRLSVPRRAQRALNRLRDDRFSYIPFEELGEVFASPESLQIETDEITQLVAEARLAAARPLPRHLPQKPQRAALERRNSRRNAYFRQDRRSADEQGAASPAQPAPQGVTRRGRNE